MPNALKRKMVKEALSNLLFLAYIFRWILLHTTATAAFAAVFHFLFHHQFISFMSVRFYKDKNEKKKSNFYVLFPISGFGFLVCSVSTLRNIV